MLPLVLNSAAERDIAAASDWYEEQREGLGIEFERCLAALSSIERSPTQNRVVLEDLRRKMVRRFPYLIYYRIEPARVMVVAVLHARQDQSKLLGRRRIH